jgi:signal transduction histidine kinase
MEQTLLTFSGVLAIAVVGIVNSAAGQLWSNVILHSAFGLLFLLGSYDDRLGLSVRVGRACVLGMFALSLALLQVNPDTFTLILSVVLMASAPYHFPARYCWLLMVGANLSYWLLLRRHWPPGSGFEIAFMTLVALQGFAVSSSLARHRELVTLEVLSRQNDELRAARAMLALQSRNEERIRIAGDLHDTIGHRLTALRLQLEALGHRLPKAFGDEVERCKLLAADILEDIRSIVRQMSEEQRSGLAASLEAIGKLTPGVELVVEPPLPAFPADLNQQLLLCLQEAVHNAIRHGGADRVTVRWRDGALQIADNGSGPGAVAPMPGFGLTHIDKRLAPFRGSARLSAGDGGRGCVLRLELPGVAAP